jgi:hypothetical protein
VTRGNPTGSATGSGNNTENFRFGQAGGASLAVNGLRPQNNNFTLDGIDNNETLVNTIVFFPPADAIEKFRVETSVPPAEIGRAGDAVVATSLKSGKTTFTAALLFSTVIRSSTPKTFSTVARSPASTAINSAVPSAVRSSRTNCFSSSIMKGSARSSLSAAP